MTGVEAMNVFLRHAAANDLPGYQLYRLKAEAFGACARDSRERGDDVLAEGEAAAAARAWAAAEVAALAETSPGVAGQRSTTLRCCNGYALEHFDFCQVGAAIAAARWSIARSQTVRP